MKLVADLHIHSHFSMSTSPKLTPGHLELWGRIKGITVVGTGDFTHPGWLAELEEKLEPGEEGLLRLREAFRLPHELAAERPVRFLLTAEVSNIYRSAGATRKVHNLVLVPDFASARRIQTRLGAVGNITSDGRPILGLDSRDLLEIVLESSPHAMLIPAHIWTPWFSVLGSRSGFQRIEECYRDLAGHIRAVETGLSSDPPMNRMCGFLDRYTLVSNSDAHSPEKLGREANLLDTELSYGALLDALEGRTPEAFLGTLEFFPQEGKYHFDGHRKCGVRWDPRETAARGGMCPVCGRPVTVGVLNRVYQLADRASPAPSARPFHSLIPLSEILAEILAVGAQSRRVARLYHRLAAAAGSELALLMSLPIPEVEALGTDALAEAVRRMRAGEVLVEEGYDGQYGRVRLFAHGERAGLGSQELLFRELADRGAAHAGRPGRGAAAPPAGLRSPWEPAGGRPASPPEQPSLFAGRSEPGAGLNREQAAAAVHGEGPALVIAGPGTGKTRTLAHRVARLLGQQGAEEGVLALTFTNRAARQMNARVQALLPQGRLRSRLSAGTFHAFGLGVLREHAALVGRRSSFALIGEEERREILSELAPGARLAGRLAEAIRLAKQRLWAPSAQPPTAREAASSAFFSEPEQESVARRYQELLQENNAVDLDDLVRLPVLLYRNHPEVLAAWRRRFRWVLVDEVQDINPAQYALLTVLAPPPQGNLFAIGDPDQSIYAFRGADPRLTERLRQDYPALKEYRLATSYRCPDTVLQAAGQLLRGGAEEIRLAGLDPGVRVRVMECPSAQAEAELVARTIEELMGGLRFFSMDSGISAGLEGEGIGGLSDFAILCRTSHQFDALHKALDDHAIPCQRVGDSPFFRTAPLRDAVDLAGLARGALPELLAGRLRRRFAGRLPELLAAARAGVEVRSVLATLAQLLGADPGEEPWSRLLEEAGPFGEDWRGFLEHAVLAARGEDYRGEVERVALLTLHAAKGLEFPCVFVTGCEDGLLPYRLHGETADPAEEARLLYVGMTRARRFLYLTSAARRRLFGRELHLRRSPFLERIKEELLDRREGGGPPRRRREEGQLRLF